MIPRRIWSRLLPLGVLWALCVNAGKIDWDSARSPAPGIRWVQLKRRHPRLMRIAIMRIDLTTPGLRIVTTGRDAEWGKPMPDHAKFTIATRRITTAEFMRRARTSGVDMVAAFNAAPWLPWEKPFTHKYGHPLGINISNGRIVSDSHPELPALVVWKNGKVEILETVDRKRLHRIRDAVSGFGLIAKNGRLLPDSGYARGLMPRLAYGLSGDRRYLYVIAIDGRQPKWSLGATGSEAWRLLLDAGARDAINMDGGGSATLCYWDKRKKQPTVLNRHTAGGYLRPVASNVGVVIEKSSGR
ncbi:MAG: phosphodiester glycosidase family protein [Lentisphaeria bacterium]|nr:phosphodiester glycosidase family protein [Lentisphaeria bacterium]